MEKVLFVKYMEIPLDFFLKITEHMSINQKVVGKKLELQKEEIGKYYTDENFIYFDDVKINRKTLSFQKYSSFRGECKAYKNKEDFKKNFDLESLTKENKI